MYRLLALGLHPNSGSTDPFGMMERDRDPDGVRPETFERCFLCVLVTSVTFAH
jgi:hypothetical protein